MCCLAPLTRGLVRRVATKRRRHTHLDLAASHGVVTGPFLIFDQANGPPHFTAFTPAFLPTQTSKPSRYFFAFDGLFLVSGVMVTERTGC